MEKTVKAALIIGILSTLCVDTSSTDVLLENDDMYFFHLYYQTILC